MAGNTGFSLAYRAAQISTLASHTLKIAFYSVALDKDLVTAYSATNECPNTGGYTTGGYVLTPQTSLTTDPPFLHFGATFSTPTAITVPALASFLIYDSTNANLALQILNLGAPQFLSSQIVTIYWPAQDVNNAIIRCTG
jgi:hypothetical protein